jgi:hypothetical protein
MEPITPPFQALLELISLLSIVSSAGVLGLIVNIFFQYRRAKKNNGNPGLSPILQQQNAQTLQKISESIILLTSLQSQQAGILSTLAQNIQNVKTDTSGIPAIAGQIQSIQTCLAVVKDRLSTGGS